MKKTLFLGLLTFVIASTSFAQVKVGLTAGLNISSFIESGEDAESYSYLAGFQGGLVVDLSVTENISVIPEILFSQRGTYQLYEQEDNSKNTVKYYATLNYVQVPVNLAYKIPVGKSAKVMIFAGPYFGYGLSGQIKYEANIDGEKESETEDIEFGSSEDKLKAIDFGANAGAGMQFGKGFFKVQYNLGLNNLYNISSATLKNKNIAITLGYFF